MIENKKILNFYNDLKGQFSEEEANYIILNSLSILGDKKIKPENYITDFAYKRINKYKYPERLLLFMKLTSEKTKEWKENSFTKLALEKII